MRPPTAGWHIGSDVYLGHGVILDVGEHASLRVGDGVKVFHHSLIGAFDEVTIRDEVQIAESVTIRDHNHATHNIDMHRTLVSDPVTIGAGAWIARGVAVLAGATVGEGAVVAANAVITRGTCVPPMSVVGGVPAKPLSKSGTRLSVAG
ncbi:acyltransferase [Arthrobacter sp. ISL-72]|nr:acyltransferase [Arthrobacter sp. ISL-72]